MASVSKEIAYLRAEKERFLIVFASEGGKRFTVDSRGSQKEVWEMLGQLKRHLDSRFPDFFGFYRKPFKEEG